MYAVIVSGGKQHRVEKGETLKLEKIEAAKGDSIEFDQVLLLADNGNVNIGKPVLDGAKVTAEVIDHGRADKVTIIKFRRRKHSMKRQGHRQWYTEVKITDIAATGAGKKAKAPAKAKKAAPKSEGPDDLARMTGVGPVIVSKLADIGITTFQQIADLTPEAVNDVETELNAKGRIGRENWIEQAKAILKEG